MPASPAERMRLKRRLDREDPDRKNRKLDSKFIFQNVDVSVIIDENDKVWYKGVDLGRALKMADPHVSVCNGIDAKYCQRYDTLVQNLPQYRHIPGMQPKTTFVNDIGMYLYVMRSRKPLAEAFVEWVCGEVLPSICRTNKYEVDPAENPLRDLNELLNQKIDELNNRNTSLVTENVTLKTENISLGTKIDTLEKSHVNLEAESAKIKQVLDDRTNLICEMKPSNVPPLQDKGKLEYFILYRKYDLNASESEKEQYKKPYYICRIQQHSIEKRYLELTKKFKNLQKLLELRVPNSVVFFNYLMEHMPHNMKRSLSSMRLMNGTTESEMITMIQNCYQKLHGNEYNDDGGRTEDNRRKCKKMKRTLMEYFKTTDPMPQS